MNLIERLRERLAQSESAAIDAIVTAAEESSLSLFLVGGSVRDLLLGQLIFDIDLVVEGDAAALAHQAATRLDCHCIVHKAFGTATVQNRDYSFDIAMSRSETYPRPGILPIVSSATIDHDLPRRDFTVNAIALTLTKPDKGRIIDPGHGEIDLQHRLLRVFHDRSFADDATRILRAIRYEARLQFEIEPHTISLLQRDMHYLNAISGPRLRQELARLLTEETPEVSLHRACELGVLKTIHPAFLFTEQLTAAFTNARLQDCGAPLPTVYLALLAHNWSITDGAAISRRLAFTKWQRSIVAEMPRLRLLTSQLALPEGRPSEMTALLAPFSLAAVQALALLTTNTRVRSRTKTYLEEWRHVKAELDGAALIELGFGQGPKMGQLISHLQRGRLDGELTSRKEEIDLVRSLSKRP